MSEAALKTPEQVAEQISAAGDRVIEKLRLVYDPEIPVNIFDMGLIYKVDIDPTEDDQFDVRIDMTLTSPNCPVAGQMPMMVQSAVGTAEGVKSVKVSLIWEPPWDKSRMSDEARLSLNMY